MGTHANVGQTYIHKTHFPFVNCKTIDPMWTESNVSIYVDQHQRLNTGSVVCRDSLKIDDTRIADVPTVRPVCHMSSSIISHRTTSATSAKTLKTTINRFDFMRILLPVWKQGNSKQCNAFEFPYCVDNLATQNPFTFDSFVCARLRVCLTKRSVTSNCDLIGFELHCEHANMK